MTSSATVHFSWCDPSRCTTSTATNDFLVPEHRSAALAVPAFGAAVVAWQVWMVQPLDETDGPTIAIEATDTPAGVPERCFVYRARVDQGRMLLQALSQMWRDRAHTGVRTWNGVDHPWWCDPEWCEAFVNLNPDEDELQVAFEHKSRPVECDSRADDDLSIAVYLQQAPTLPAEAVTWVEFQLPHDVQGFPLLGDQILALRQALRTVT